MKDLTCLSYIRVSEGGYYEYYMHSIYNLIPKKKWVEIVSKIKFTICSPQIQGCFTNIPEKNFQ